VSHHVHHGQQVVPLADGVGGGVSLPGELPHDPGEGRVALPVLQHTARGGGWVVEGLRG